MKILIDWFDFRQCQLFSFLCSNAAISTWSALCYLMFKLLLRKKNHFHLADISICVWVSEHLCVCHWWKSLAFQCMYGSSVYVFFPIFVFSVDFSANVNENPIESRNLSPMLFFIHYKQSLTRTMNTTLFLLALSLLPFQPFQPISFSNSLIFTQQKQRNVNIQQHT